MNKTFTARSIIVILATIALASTGLVKAYNGPYTYVNGPSDPMVPPEGDYKCPYVAIGGGIVVNGGFLDWDTDAPSNDLFAPMFRPNAPQDYTYQSDLFLRYEPVTNTLYVLVLTIPGFEGSRDAGEAWVKLDGNPTAVSFTDFAWVELDPSEYPGNVRGFEASLTLPNPSDTTREISVHLNVYGVTGGVQTSRTFVIPMIINQIPEAPVLALTVSMFGVFGLFAAHNRKRL